MNQPRPDAGVNWLDRILAPIASWMAALSGIILFAMMFLVVANTLMRKFFNAPLTGAFEITQSLLTIAVFFSLAYTQRQDGHISVDVLSRHFSAPVRRIMRPLMLLLGVICFTWATYANGGFAWQSIRIDEQEWGEITYPLWPVKILMCVGLAVLTVQFLADTLRETRAALREHPG